MPTPPTPPTPRDTDELDDEGTLVVEDQRFAIVADWVITAGASVRAPHSWLEHQGLLEAIITGDEDPAESEARHHVLAARARFRRSPDAAD